MGSVERCKRYYDARINEWLKMMTMIFQAVFVRKPHATRDEDVENDGDKNKRQQLSHHELHSDDNDWRLM